MTNQLEVSLKELDLFDSDSNRIKQADPSSEQIVSSLLSKQTNYDYEFPKNEPFIPDNSMQPTQMTTISKSNENCSSRSFSKSKPNSLSITTNDLKESFSQIKRNNHIQNSNHSMENILERHETSPLVSSVSNLRGVNIEQNLNTRISHEVCSSENLYQSRKEFPLSLKFNNEIKNGRNKSISTSRYATVSNFAIPLEREFSNESNPNKPLSNSVELVNKIYLNESNLKNTEVLVSMKFLCQT